MEQNENACPMNVDDLPLVAHVEMDRFCEGCGYNLRTQAVRREPRTQILIVRCPECARIHPAAEAATVAHVWLRRLAMLGLAFWILLIVSWAIGVALGQFGITLFTLEELTTTVSVPHAVRSTPGYRGPYYTRQPRPTYRELNLLYAVSGVTSFGLGYLAMASAVVVCPHWRRVRYSIVAVLWPAIPAGFVALIWQSEAPNLMRWGMDYMAAHTLLCMLGGMLGVIFGRPMARLIASICLPARVRSLLAYLWLVDGKQPKLTSPQNPERK